MAQAVLESDLMDDKPKPPVPFGIGYLPRNICNLHVQHTSLMDAQTGAVAKPLRSQQSSRRQNSAVTARAAFMYSLLHIQYTQSGKHL